MRPRAARISPVLVLACWCALSQHQVSVESLGWTCCTNSRVASLRKRWCWARRQRTCTGKPCRHCRRALRHRRWTCTALQGKHSSAGTPKTTAHTTETCTTAAQTHPCDIENLQHQVHDHDRGVPISAGGAATSCSTARIPQGSARQELGHCARACVGGGAQSETCGCAATLPLKRNTPTVDVLSVANEGVRDAEGGPAGDGLHTTTGNVCRPSRNNTSDQAPAALPSTLENHLVNPYVTVIPYQTSPGALAEVGTVHFGGWHAMPCKFHQHHNSRSTQCTHPARHPGHLQHTARPRGNLSESFSPRT